MVLRGNNGIFTQNDCEIHGNNNYIYGNNCWGNGNNCVLNGNNIRWKGNNCVLNGDRCHVKGNNCVINGKHGVAEGNNCMVRGADSVARENNTHHHLDERSETHNFNFFSSTPRPRTTPQAALLATRETPQAPRERMLATLREINSEEENDESKQCGICLVHGRNIALNCGHGFCADCLVHIVQDSCLCPECRAAITSVQRVFF